MREICTSGSVGGEGGNILAYLAADPIAGVTRAPGRPRIPSLRSADGPWGGRAINRAGRR